MTTYLLIGDIFVLGVLAAVTAWAYLPANRTRNDYVSRIPLQDEQRVTVVSHD